jgi:hypothetical protein
MTSFTPNLTPMRERSTHTQNRNENTHMSLPMCVYYQDLRMLRGHKSEIARPIWLIRSRLVLTHTNVHVRGGAL